MPVGDPSPPTDDPLIGKVLSERYRIVKKIMIDTVSQRSEDVVRVMYDRLVKTKNPFMTTNEIATETRYPMTTIRRILDDLNLLKAVARKGVAGSGFKHVWSLSPYILRCVTESEVYSDPVVRRLVHLQRCDRRSEDLGD